MNRPIFLIVAVVGAFAILAALLLIPATPAPQPPVSQPLPTTRANLPTGTRAPATTFPARTTRAPIPSSAPATTAPVPSSTLPPPTSLAYCPQEHSHTVFLNAQERRALEELLTGYTGTVSVYYYAPQNGESFGFQEQKLHYSASLVKVPYALYLLTLADQGKCDLSLEMTLEEAHKQAGTGLLKDRPAGQVYTVRELIEYMITVSDNTAFKMLRQTYSLWGYDRFCREQLGVNTPTYKNVTATDMALCLQATYEYLATGTPNALFLQDLMARANNRFIKAPGAQLILHKYGWANPSLNDMAIVYQEHPYLLVILTDHAQGTREDLAIFSTVSKTLKKFHDTVERISDPADRAP